MLILTISLLFSHFASSSLLLEYNFYKNFGKRFYDYSKKNHSGLNGRSSDSNDYETFPTDRGAYFEQNSSIQVHSIRTLPIFLLLWVKILKLASPSYIFTRRFSNGEEFSLSTSLSTSLITFNLWGNVKNKNITSSQVSLSEWIFIAAVGNTTLNKLSINGGYFLSNEAYLQDYENTSGNPQNLKFYLGAEYRRESFVGFLFKFQIFDEEVNLNDFLGSKTGNCFISNCNYCLVSMKIGSEIYCLPSNNRLEENSAGVSCPSSDYGCIGSVALKCQCQHKSCIVSNSQAICLCRGENQGTSTDCSCSSRQVFNGNSCTSPTASCQDKYCLICENSGDCLTCKDLNSLPNLRSCDCQEGYSEAVDATPENRCVRCSISCKKCFFNMNCSECSDSSWVINQFDKKKCTSSLIDNKCPDRYYGTYPNCNNCQETCQTCTNSSSCTSCIQSSMIVNADKTCHCSENQIFNKHFEKCVCNDNYFLTTDQTSCYTCKFPCLKCSEKDPTYCKTCPETFTLIEGKCLCDSSRYMNGNICILCSENFYINSKKDGCYFCDKKCEKCSETNSESNNCLSCNNPFIFNNGLCECPENSYMKNSECIECDTENSTFLLQNKSDCYQCPAFCQRCNESHTEICLQCKESFELINGSCKCPFATFKNSTNYCQNCSENCISCEKFSICDKCQDNFTVNSNDLCEFDCEIGYFANYNECLPCGNYCINCNSTNCIDCKNNSGHDGDFNCKCFDGFGGQESCEQLTFSGELKVDEKNILELRFEKDVQGKLNQSNFKLNFKPKTEIDLKFYRNSSSVFIFELFPEEDIKKNTKVYLEIIYKEELRSTDNFLLVDYNYSSFLYEYSKPYQSPKSVQVVANNTQTIVKAAASSSVLVALMSNPACFWVFMNTLEIISFLPLNDVPYSDQLEKFFTSFGTFNLIPNPLKDLVSLDDSLTPYSEAKNYGFDTSLFHINAGSYLINLAFFLILIPILYIGHKCCFRFISQKCEKWLQNYKYNFFLRFWIQSYLNLTILAAIQLKSESDNSVWSLVSIGLSFINIIFSIFSPLFLIGFGFLNREAIIDKDEDLIKRWGSIYEEFKNNKKFLSTQFYSVFLIRRLLFVFSQIYLNRHIYIQQAMNIIGSVFQFIFMIYYLPFQEGLIGISSYLGELCTIEVMIISVIIVDTKNQKMMMLLENIIVYSVLTTIILQTLISLILLAKAIKRLCLKLHGKRVSEFVKNAEKVYPEIFKDDTQNGEIVVTSPSSLNRTNLS